MIQPAKLFPLAERARPELDLSPGPRPVYSRSLLLPGPLPPLSPFGAGLLRHAIDGGLRYALYHLGLPAPETSPVVLVRLRPYFEACSLRHLLTPVPGGADVVAALLEPGGAGGRPAEDLPLAAALSFHRVRLRPFRAPALRPAVLRGGERPAELWRAFRERLDRALGRVHDALLADLVSSLDRRASRAQGEEVPPVLSLGAWTLRTRGRGDLRRFGLPDPLAPCWAEAEDLARAARHALEPHPVPGHDRYRGRFREAWRAALTQIAPFYRALGRSAAERGLLADPDDAFFLPFEEAGRLAADADDGELAGLVRDHRAEYESLQRTAEPLDLMSERQEMGADGGERPEWAWAPLLPLP